MSFSFTLPIMCLVLTGLSLACVDPLDQSIQGKLDVVVVDGTITNLPEPQIIRLNRSTSDPLTGLPGSVPLTGAKVEVLVDSTQTVSFTEADSGHYLAPNGFTGLVGHAYQLRFTLSDGTNYISTKQVMQAVPPISKVTAQFDSRSLSSQQLNRYTAGHNISVQTQDPAEQRNFYRWEWKLYERQYWCQTCTQGVYSVYKVLPDVYKDRDYFVTGTELYENCFCPPAGMARYDAPDVPKDYWNYDYPCRSACWEILYSYNINVFSDQYSNGGLISKKQVAHIPFYNYQPCLVDIRQYSLTPDAYQYYKLFQDQSQNTGGVADTPPSALGGNIYKVNSPRTVVVGYFTASAVSVIHHWLDRKDTQGVAYGATDPSGPHSNVGDDLFYALNARRPSPEPPPPYQGGRDVPKIRIWPNINRPPTAPCLQSDNRTPYKPEGWQN